MYGHGVAPPPRSAGTVITFRVLFALCGFFSCGLLACVPLFRAAVLRGRRLDWALAWLSMPVSIGALAMIGALPESDPRTDVALAVVLLLGAGSAAYFVMVDIRHHQLSQRQFAGYAPPGQQPPAGYGYPQQASPYSGTQISQTPHAQTPHAQTPHAQTPHAQTPHAQAPGLRPPMPGAAVPGASPPQPPVAPTSATPQRPAPARIDQVRAELDELSDYLRRQEHGPEDGR